jgi:hypothetical protein
MIVSLILHQMRKKQECGFDGFSASHDLIVICFRHDYQFYGNPSPPRLESHPPNVPPEPNPSTNMPILAAVDTSDQNTIEKTTAKTKNIIATPNRFLPDLIRLSPLFIIGSFLNGYAARLNLSDPTVSLLTI